MTAIAISSRRISVAVTMALVSGLSLLLLIYVGNGEAQRTYEQFHLEKLVAQNKVVQSAVKTFLRRGLPLEQYVGFGTRAARLLASDDTIAALAVFDDAGRQVFASGDATIRLLPDAAAEQIDSESEAEVRRTERYIQVVLPLDNRYERVGSLAITMPRAVVADRVWASFEPLLVPAVGVSLLFAAFVAFATPWLARQRAPWLQIIYALVFGGMSLAVIVTLVALYSEGAQAKTKALADSLGQRLTQIVRFHLDIDQIAGLDQAFTEYRRLNPDISAAALTVDGQVVIHTDPVMVGGPWVSQRDAYEYVVDITPPGSTQQVQTAVALPADIVYWRVARSVKNFAALFVASAFLATVFLQLIGAMQRLEPGRGGQAPARGENALNLIKPVFYVAMCVEHLTYSFLPQFTYDTVVRAGLPTGSVSVVFMVYYLCFALTLMPAGHYAERIGQRSLMVGGLTLIAAGLVALMLPFGVIGIGLGRAVGGVGQGMLFMGVQSYILTVAAPRRKTQGAAIIVFGFQGGMISGMAVGSLLVGYIGSDGVFGLGAAVAAAMALYAAVLVPAATLRRPATRSLAMDLRQLARDTKRTLRSRELLNAIGLIGMPAKAVLTGVIVFALPLLMAQRDYAQEDIGQVVMIYAAGVVLASRWASRLVDQTGQSWLVLFLGAVISGFGLILMALIVSPALANAPYAGALETVVLIAGVAIVGLAHGLINAPIVTHVADLDVARQIGASSATAAYRFLERVGHVGGPIIVGQLFMFTNQDPAVLAWIGIAVASLGLIFVIRERGRILTAAPVTDVAIDGPRDVLGLYMHRSDLVLVVAAEADPSGAAAPPAARTRARLGHRDAGSDDTGEAGGRALAAFLGAIERRAPQADDLHLLLARSTDHRRPTIRRWLRDHPRYRLHVASSASDWQDQMMQCLRLVAARRAGDGARGARQLASAIAVNLQAYDGIARSFVWIAPDDERPAAGSAIRHRTTTPPHHGRRVAAARG